MNSEDFHTHKKEKNLFWTPSTCTRPPKQQKKTKGCVVSLGILFCHHWLISHSCDFLTGIFLVFYISCYCLFVWLTQKFCIWKSRDAHKVEWVAVGLVYMYVVQFTNKTMEWYKRKYTDILISTLFRAVVSTLGPYQNSLKLNCFGLFVTEYFRKWLGGGSCFSNLDIKA